MATRAELGSASYTLRFSTELGLSCVWKEKLYFTSHTLTSYNESKVINHIETFKFPMPVSETRAGILAVMGKHSAVD